MISDGVAWAWGYNGFGQVGNGNTNSQPNPVPMTHDNGFVVTGATAVEWGLGHRAVPAGETDVTAEALARQLASGPTVSLGLTKWLLHTGAEHTLDQHLRDEAFAMELSSRSEDFREGLQAFVEKRDPGFTGR